MSESETYSDKYSKDSIALLQFTRSRQLNMNKGESGFRVKSKSLKAAGGVIGSSLWDKSLNELSPRA